ncbi:hypothetical protein [Paenibacillus hexagrammi]|uniref:Uncharacterized protein n=1 Tax=Paenibacillus hexagrammi TaxID=2908839 RepID=A0ABY3SKF6_9BACL|nr:hypothetical protein [Paenibacillus sp. YPD9-1]UJF33870.1 hypothetical protein L0M14_00980 [Paenibacillus sp. YPD9-1]
MFVYIPNRIHGKIAVDAIVTDIVTFTYTMKRISYHSWEEAASDPAIKVGIPIIRIVIAATGEPEGICTGHRAQTSFH